MAEIYLELISVGDSGGPLICRNRTDNDFIYLAGIISGNHVPNNFDPDKVRCGTKGTFGTHTSVSRYILWIENIMRNKEQNDTSEILFAQNCPGVKCAISNHCVPRDSFADCIDGEDEL